MACKLLQAWTTFCTILHDHKVLDCCKVLTRLQVRRFDQVTDCLNHDKVVEWGVLWLIFFELNYPEHKPLPSQLAQSQFLKECAQVLFTTTVPLLQQSRLLSILAMSQRCGFVSASLL